MPRVHFVKKARKDVPNSDIKKGEGYFWWKFNYGAKHVDEVKDDVGEIEEGESKEDYQNRLKERAEEMDEERKEEILEEIQAVSYNGE